MKNASVYSTYLSFLIGILLAPVQQLEIISAYSARKVFAILSFLLDFNWTVSVILISTLRPPCKESNAQFTPEILLHDLQ